MSLRAPTHFFQARDAISANLPNRSGALEQNEVMVDDACAPG